MLPQHHNCTGCGSCAAACPQKCIAMIADDEGFRYPKIDAQYCIDCKKCEKACPVINIPSVSGTPTAFAVQNMDSQIRQGSSSGGIFSALSEDILAQGGKVCAAVYDEDFSVCHRIVETREEIASMRGAKYSQSKVEHCFGPIKEALLKQVPVLFVGTPCQCAALRSYLGRDYDSLLLVDMICHGVPSPSVWQDYLQERRKTDAPNSRLTRVNLRSKATGWSHYAYSTEFTYADGSQYSVPQGQNAFSRGFTSNLFLRPSCANCSFKGTSRCSDMTLGDYWGIWHQYPEFDDNKGTSLLLIQSEKGFAEWNRIADRCQWLNVPVSDAIQQNPSALQSSATHPAREIFFAQRHKKRSLEKWIWECLLPREDPLLKRLLRKILRK